MYLLAVGGYPKNFRLVVTLNASLNQFQGALLQSRKLSNQHISPFTKVI